jgi:hypothetical protein
MKELKSEFDLADATPKVSAPIAIARTSFMLLAPQLANANCIGG